MVLRLGRKPGPKPKVGFNPLQSADGPQTGARGMPIDACGFNPLQSADGPQTWAFLQPRNSRDAVSIRFRARMVLRLVATCVW